MSGSFYIAFTEGYDDPMTLVGPYPSFDAAVQAHYDSVSQAGESMDLEGITPHQFYLDDDAVRIGKVEVGP